MQQLPLYLGNVTDSIRAASAEVISIWLVIQFSLIVVAILMAMAIAALIRRRTDIVSMIMGWPPKVRMVIHALIGNLASIIFIILIVVARAAMLLLTLPSRSYLLSAAASLVSAWVIIAILTSMIRNKFVNRVVAVAAWTIAALSILGLLEPTAATLDSVGISLGGLRITPLLLFKTVSLLLIALWLVLAASNFFDRKLSGFSDLTPSLQVLLGKLIRLTLIILAVVVVLSSVGIDLSALALFSGAVGVGIGFGLQKIVSNLVSGIILLADKSIKPGDVITVGSNFGWVTTMGARYTSVNTRDGREFLVPNEDFITQKVINWSYSNEQVRLEVGFGVSYDSDPHRVRDIAAAAALKVPRVLKNPPPVCHLIAFGDSSLDFLMRFWISDPADGTTNVRGPVMLELWDAFKREGIEIPYPVRDLRIDKAVRIAMDRQSGPTG